METLTFISSSVKIRAIRGSTSFPLMKFLFFLILPLLLSACTVFEPIDAKPIRHLLEATVPARTPSKAAPAIAIARPSLPPYLERSEMVTRTGDGRLEIHEKDLWSEPLDSAITRVLAENLRRLTGSTNVQPASSFITRDYTHLVELRIERFDPQPDGTLLLECTWKLQPMSGGDAAPASYRTTVPLPASADRSARITAMNEALARLSRVISGKL
jgi:uncharacterized lipoprotein YmbA